MAKQLVDFPIKNDIQIDDSFSYEQFFQEKSLSAFDGSKNTAKVRNKILIMTPEVKMKQWHPSIINLGSPINSQPPLPLRKWPSGSHN